jgi:hypothetical protein
MRARALAAATALTGALFVLSPAHANTVWDFSTPTGALGQSHNYTGNDGTSVINAQAFGPGPVQLFGKNLLGDELGLGLTNDPSGQNEITPGSFVQLDLTKLVLTSLIMSFSANSVTAPETVQVFGSSTSGVLGASMLFSCTATLPGTCEQDVNIANAGSFKFLDVTAFGTGSNVLLHTVDAAVVPGPIVGAGLPGLVAACGGLLTLVRRRRRRLA